VVNEKARVCGKVKASHVIINAEVRGSLPADEHLALQPKVRIVGDVRYELLERHQRAAVEGKLRPLKGTGRPALKLVASHDV
jgi:cytoskeletal protein CcmA (bactofilin family)